MAMRDVEGVGHSAHFFGFLPCNSLLLWITFTALIALKTLLFSQAYGYLLCLCVCLCESVFGYM